MANQRAWWTLVISQEPHGPHDSSIRLSDTDTEHIASLISKDVTEGEIVDGTPEPDPEPGTLVWDGHPGSDQRAESRLRLDPKATSATYHLFPHPPAPGETGETRWSLTLIQYTNGIEFNGAGLGERHPDEQTAKDYAATGERHGTARPVD